MFDYLLEMHNKKTLSEWGGKARNLNLLYPLTKRVPNPIKIPNGFVITAKDFSDIIESQTLEECIKNIGGFPIAVRSSGKFEDMAGASFAGLYETYLEVNTISETFKYIKDCFDSVKSERVFEYLKKKEIKLSESELNNQMTVLIQKMVEPKISGVAFSIDPLQGDERQCLIECVAGLGERMVSGTVTPTRYHFDYFKEQIIDFSSGEDEVILTSNSLQILANYILEIQAHFKCPQDIEWSIDNSNQIWILQSRPITKINWRKDVGELTNADLRDGGISARVCTPIMYSLYEWVMNESMGNYFYKIGLNGENDSKDWIFNYYGRGYWNAAKVKQSLYAIPGFSEKGFDDDLGIQKEYGTQGPVKVGLTPKLLLKALPILMALTKEYKDSKEMIDSFKTTFELLDLKWKRTFFTIVPIMTNSEFNHIYKDLIFDYYIKTEKNYFRTIYNNSNFQSDLKTFITKLEKKINIKINLNSLMSSLEDVSHIEIQKDLNRIAFSVKTNGKESELTHQVFDEFMSKHYHHGDAELDLLEPRWGEKPNRIWEMAKTEVCLNTKKAHSIYKNELEKVQMAIESLPFYLRVSARKKFDQMITEARYFLVNREKMREFSTRSYYLVRVYTLELGKRLKVDNLIQDETDVFFLPVKDLLVLIFSNKISPYLKKKLHLNKLMYQGMTNINPPNEFGEFVTQQEVPTLTSNTLQGVACSSGIFKGIARIARTLEETKNIKEGEILVTKFTDPGWTPVLGKVNAVVTEVGGMLSHAAVISREYGIPAVLNIQNIMNLVEDGQVIEVNGNDGTVRIADDNVS
jgi:phosphohistidine swiveling domain-containing protein